MIELFCSLLKKAPKKVVKIIAEKPAISLGATSLFVTLITKFVKSKSIQEGYLSNINAYNNYGSYNGGRIQYLEEIDSDTIVRDQKHPEFRYKVEEGCRKETLEMNLNRSKEGK